MNKPTCPSKDVDMMCLTVLVVNWVKPKLFPFHHHRDITTNCFDLIHMDVWRIASSISHSASLNILSLHSSGI